MKINIKWDLSKFNKHLIWPIREFLSSWRCKKWNPNVFSCASIPVASSNIIFFRPLSNLLLLKIFATFLLHLLMCGPFIFLRCLSCQLHFLFPYLKAGLSVRLKSRRYCTSKFNIFSSCFYFCDDVWQRLIKIFICLSFLTIFTCSFLDSLGTCLARWVECCKLRLRP